MDDVVIWSIKDLIKTIKARQLNEYDANIAVSGDRGNGKSTFIAKFLYRFEHFKPWTHQVYSRDDVINLLKTQRTGICWDDEAINSGYKRNFQDKGQQELIRILTAYRDNFNVYCSAIPNFFSLDKDLRELYCIHIQIIERGTGVVHLPLQSSLFTQDRWDTKYNAKIEESWTIKRIKNPKFCPDYSKLSTFAGYIFFNDLTEAQRVLYKEIKKEKREKSFKTETEKEKEDKDNKETTWLQNIFKMVIEGKLDNKILLKLCLANNKKHSHTSSLLNRMIKDNGYEGTLGNYLQGKVKVVDNEGKKEEMNNLLF